MASRPTEIGWKSCSRSCPRGAIKGRKAPAGIDVTQETRPSIFAHNVNPQTGQPGGQASVIGVDDINRPVDAKFGPDGALYLVDIGAIRDAGMTGAGVLDPAHAPFVQIPGTGVIWKISPL